MSLKTRVILDRRLVMIVAFTFSLLVAMPPQSGAVMVESRTSDGQTMSQRADDLDTVRNMLEKEVVVQRLADYGYTQQEALARVQNASDEQLHQLAGLSDNLAAGADAAGVLVSALVIVLLVILILKITNNEIVIH